MLDAASGLPILTWLSQALPQHSPSLCTQSKQCGEVLDLSQRQGLGEGVSQHVIHGAWCRANGPHFNGLVMVHVNVLGLKVVLVAAWGCNSCW
jgi:hypothetical protein